LAAGPNRLLSLAWLAIVTWELVSGSSRLLETVGTAIWIILITLARRGFIYVAGLTVLVVVLGAAGMLSFEDAPQAGDGISSYWDALWWTGMLVTSIGSDYWPQTTEGRLLCPLLSVCGLAVLGYVTATLASFFVGRDAAAKGGVAGSSDMATLAAEIRSLRREIQSLSRRISEPAGSRC
jgi:voltage-gated potassium channel